MAAVKRKKRFRKPLIIGICILAVLVIVGRVQVGLRTKPAEIETTKLKIGMVEEKLTETGNIELLRTVEVKSKIAGTVSDIMVNEGDHVASGQVLAVIDPDPTQTLLLLQKRSAVTQNRINLDQAEKELARLRELARSSLVSEKDVEDAENNFLLRQNAFTLAQQELDIMEREIETSGEGTEERIVASKVRAPYDGYITRRYVEEGAIVTSGISSVAAGTDLFQIGDPSTRIIRAQISEVDIGRVDVGNDVRIMLDAYPDTSFAGRIKHIAPVGGTVSGRNVITFKTEIEILDGDPRLRPGMSCDVDILIAREDSTLWLPIESIHETTEGSGDEDGDDERVVRSVYVKHDDFVPKKKKWGMFGAASSPFEAFDPREVTVGIVSENRMQILSGVDTTMVIALDATAVAEALEALNDTAAKTDTVSDDR